MSKLKSWFNRLTKDVSVAKKKATVAANTSGQVSAQVERLNRQAEDQCTSLEQIETVLSENRKLAEENKRLVGENKELLQRILSVTTTMEKMLSSIKRHDDTVRLHKYEDFSSKSFQERHLQ